MEERHEVSQRIFEQMGAYCPFGMTGTLIGDHDVAEAGRPEYAHRNSRSLDYHFVWCNTGQSGFLIADRLHSKR